MATDFIVELNQKDLVNIIGRKGAASKTRGKINLVDFTGNIFSNCIFVNLDVSFCDFQEAIFYNCKFLNCKFKGCDFCHASFRDCSFKGVTLISCNFSMSNLCRCDTSNVSTEMCNFDDAKIFNTPFRDFLSRKTSFNYSTVDACTFSNIRFEECCLDLDIERSRLTGGYIEDSIVSGLWNHSTLDRINFNCSVIREWVVDGSRVKSNCSFIDTPLSQVEGLVYATTSFTGFGDRNRVITGIRFGKTNASIRFFCGCFSGNTKNLREYIDFARRYSNLTRTRTKAMDFILSCISVGK